MNTPKHVAVLDRITAERRRQDELRAMGRFKYTCADPEPPAGSKFLILTEEVGEVARAIQNAYLLRLEPEDVGDLREELIQVAAIACAWAESLED